jgi:uncharacterized protein DUF5615
LLGPERPSTHNDEWFEVSDKDWLGPRFKGKKLKLLLDAQVPEAVAREIKGAKVTAHALSQVARRRSDAEITQIAQRRGLVILTLDRDFWDDRKQPLHMLQQGIIYVAEPPDQPDRILRAFGLVYGCFAKSYPLDWWNHMKVKATVGAFEIKMRTWQGKVARYKLKLRRGYVVAKEISFKSSDEARQQLPKPGHA